jgi:hypothetical protein
LSTQHTLTAPSAGFALAIALMLTSCGSTSHDAGATANGPEQAAAAAPTAPAQEAPNGTADAGDFAARTGQLSNPDNATMVFLYYDLAGIPPPIDDWTERDNRVQVAPGPDKAARRAQVHGELAAGMRAVRGVGVLHLAMQANLSDYDPTYSEFTIRALSPSSQVEFDAFGQKVELSFDNALDAQSWHVPAADAQNIRDRINQRGVQMDLTVKIDKVLPGPAGGTIVARVLHYDLRETNGDTTLARVDVPQH